MFRRNDENEIGVIPRLRFKWILEGIPLGLTQIEINTILDNDIIFDRYGNVDYNTILNTDLYSKLELQDIEKQKLHRVAESVKKWFMLDVKNKSIPNFYKVLQE